MVRLVFQKYQGTGAEIQPVTFPETDEASVSPVAWGNV